ncbi:phage tail fiber protein [Nocardiopsis alba]|uniref:phage tail fiber protein n=1 Tax=Nocardiopsis alba TaxID=53437 RepID=UPI003D720A98
MLSGGTAVAVRMSLHSAQPNTAGNAELSGSGYERQTISWASPSGGSVATSGPAIFNVPAVASITHAGLWTASGTWLGWLRLATAQPFPTPGTLTVEQATVTLQSATS